MTKIYYSCDEIPRDWGRYTSLCNALEADLTTMEHIPKIETLNTWRVNTPKGFAFFLHVDRDVVCGLTEAAATGKTALNDATRRGWELTLQRADALAAKALVLPTPISFSPGTASREQLKALSSELMATFSKPVIWEPQGMWDPILIRPWAADLGLTVAHDPFLALREDEGLGSGDAAFLISERAGMRRDFDRYDISSLLNELTSHDRAFFLLRGQYKWRHASIFRDLLEED